MGIRAGIKRFFFAFRVFVRLLKAAERGRIYGKFVGSDSPNADLADLPTVRFRANYLYNNEPFVRGAVDLLVNRAIGAGSTLQVLTGNPAVNERFEQVWNLWCYSADFYRQFHFGDLERLALLKLFTDGGVFFRVVPDSSNMDTSPISLEVLEYSRLAPFGQVEGNNRLVSGVEVDESGRVVAYHFYSAPTDIVLSRLESVRVPASEVIHFSPFRRPGQLLGIPLLAPAIPYAYHLAEIMEAELVNAKVSASFGLVIKRTGAYQHAQRYAVGESGRREFEIAPGMVEFLEPGEEIEVIDPKRPGNTFEDFVKIILRGIGRSIGLSYELVSGDKSEVNYSSARHSELELRDYLQPLRKAVERYFLRPVYLEFVRWGVQLGALNAQGGIKDWRNWTAHRWIHKGYEWVDPQKEAKAKELELRLGLTTLADEAAARGKDWRELVDQRAREVAYLNSKGLLDVSQVSLDTDAVEAFQLWEDLTGGEEDGGEAEQKGLRARQEAD